MEKVHFESLYPTDSRFDEIEKILNFIKEGNSSQVIGLPGVGRSNLFGLLSYNRNARKKHLGENQKWFHFIYVNFSEIRNKPLLEATKFLFLSLIDSLRERRNSPIKAEFAGDEKYNRVSEIFKESLSYNDELVLFQGLKRTIDLLAIEEQLTIVFLFDRFEEYIPMLTNDFFTNLRVLRNRAKYRFSVVFSLPRPLEEMIEPLLFADFHEFLAGNLVYLPIMDNPGLDFRISYLEKATGKAIDKKIIDKIISLTAGHGKLTRLSLEAIFKHDKFKHQSTSSILRSSTLRLGLEELRPEGKFETNSKNKNSNVQNVSDFDIRISDLTDFLLEQKSVSGALFEIWDALTPQEQSLISNSKSQILNFDNENYSYLEKVGLIKNKQIAVSLFAEYIKTKKSLTIEQLSNEAIVYDPNTNNILKGDNIISDKLTSSEFKLLKFFSQNQDKVLDREQVINAVWQDLKSTAGVTDQALDQLIFRIRRKIESNPNNPTRLQTVKGRGFKFTS